jgi:hypothetical protein
MLMGKVREFHAVNVAGEVDIGKHHRQKRTHLFQHVECRLGVFALNYAHFTFLEQQHRDHFALHFIVFDD